MLACDVAALIVGLAIWAAFFRENPDKTAGNRPAFEEATDPAPDRPRRGRARQRLLAENDAKTDRSDGQEAVDQSGSAAEKSFGTTGRNPVVKNAILGARSDTAAALPGDDLFRDLFIPHLEIKISSAEIASLNASPRSYVRATVREGNLLFTNVAIHLKGGPGSYRQLDDHPAFTLNFDRFADGQSFHGLKKIHLNNSVQDRSYVSEKICRELFEAAGVPTPRAGNALVKFNGREVGMYVLVEGVNKQFLGRYFKDVTGNVYDGHSGSDVTDSLPTNAGENPRDKSRLKALALAARERDLDTRLAALKKTLDLDRFLSFLAMETILWHWDGYTLNRNNFRIFHDRDSDRMVFLPHGLDQILNRSPGSLIPPAQGLVARSVLEIPETRRLYQERITQLTADVFRAGAITNRIYEVADSIGGVLAEKNPQAATAHRRQVDGFSRRIQQRASGLSRQLLPAESSHHAASRELGRQFQAKATR